MKTTITSTVFHQRNDISAKIDMNLRWRCRYEFWMCMTLGTKLQNSRDFIPIAVKLKQISGFQTTKPN